MTSHALTPEQEASIGIFACRLSAELFRSLRCVDTVEPILRDLARTLLEPVEKERDAGKAERERLRVERDDWARTAAEAREENTRLREQLKNVTDNMDRAGGDRDGMPECPWCRRGPHGDDHDATCELAAARAALEPRPPLRDEDAK